MYQPSPQSQSQPQLPLQNAVMEDHSFSHHANVEQLPLQPLTTTTTNNNNNNNTNTDLSARSPASSSLSSLSSSRSLDVLLRDLPLRPSTQALLQEHGFTGTCRELLQAVSRGGGMVNLAAELGGIAPVVAARIYREVQSALSLLHFPQQSQQSQPTGSRFDMSLSQTSAAALLSQKSRSNSSRGTPPGGPSSSSSSSSGTNRCIVTFSRQVDQLLGGGIRLGEVTELAGAPGSGKTQLAMQLAVNAQLPVDFGGVAGSTIYIDAEGSFAPTRCWDMATALVQHVRQGHERRLRRYRQLQLQQQQACSNPNNNVAIPPPPPREVPLWFTAPQILQRIHVHRVYDVAAQTAVLYNLQDRLEQQQQNNNNNNNNNASCLPIRLVVVDSIAFHYRVSTGGTSGDFVTRTRHLTNLAHRLSQLAVQYNVAIVTINQMTTKRIPSNNNNNSNNSSNQSPHQQVLVPALGVAWAHAVSTRILLQKNPTPSHHQQQQQPPQCQQQYSCHLTKSACYPSGTAHFQICQDGIRGRDFVPPPRSLASAASSSHHHQQQQPQSVGRGDKDNHHRVARSTRSHDNHGSTCGVDAAKRIRTC
ncbi:hypothetical protein ACA910_000713 [Epithemia clementina (nom. ined.)]